MFGQLSNRASLRDLIIALEAHREKLYHLGLGKNVSKTTLAKSNQDRDYRIFEEYAYFLVDEAQRKCATDIFKLSGNIYAFDSTTIDLCLNVFWRAKFRKKKGGIKVHTLYGVETLIPKFFHITETYVHVSNIMSGILYKSKDYYIFDHGNNDCKSLYHIHLVEAKFVVRAKKNLKFKTFKWKRKLPKNVLSDIIVGQTGYYLKKHYLEQFRIVRYWDEEQEREFIFFTNAMDISVLQVVELYKNRWKVEFFFKWFKQHLKNKKFWGTIETAVRIQIYSAICVYCLVAIIQYDIQFIRSTYEVLQIICISLIDKTCLRDLFESTNVQYDKDRFDPNGQLFINF